MPPRRDVEEEVYAQLYGEPPKPSVGERTRVIGDRARELRAPGDPEPPPGPPWLSRLDDVLSWAAAQTLVMQRAVRSGRARFMLAGPSARRSRPLGLGAVAVVMLTVGAFAVLSGGSPDAPEPRAAASAAPDRSGDERRQVMVAEAREARRERTARRRRAARRRAAERAEDRRAEARAARDEKPETAELVCVQGVGCVPPGTVLERSAPGEYERHSSASDDRDGLEERSDAGADGEGSSDGADVGVETSRDDDPGDIDVDVDVD